MKKNNNYFYYFVTAILLICISFQLFILFKKNNTLTAEKLFDQTTHSVVEIKASTDDVGESYGSAVFVCLEVD